MFLGNDDKGIITPSSVVGLHMHYFPFWLDFYKGNSERVAAEFDSLDKAFLYYGGTNKDALIRRFKSDLDTAHKYEAEYVVFHVSESSAAENFTLSFEHTDAEVIDASCEILNEVFADEDGSIALLVENLWQSGFKFTCPNMTKRLLDGISYKNKGIMLDTGHLLHTNTAIKTQEEGIDYIHSMLDCHKELCTHIRGVHLNQSITGDYIERIKTSPPPLLPTYEERSMQMFMHAFKTDMHLPFTCSKVKALIERISPEYLTFEFMTSSREEHSLFLKQQLECLKN